MLQQTTVQIANLTPGQVPLLMQFIRDLADYEKLSNQVVADEAMLHTALFGSDRSAEAVIATIDGIPAGFALFFHNFSTFRGKPGLYLEDLFVKPEFRGRGAGKALLLHLVHLARARGCGRFEWAVLDWNRPAIDFYQALGATPMDQWTVFRLDEADLERLAGQYPGYSI